MAQTVYGEHGGFRCDHPEWYMRKCCRHCGYTTDAKAPGIWLLIGFIFGAAMFPLLGLLRTWSAGGQ